MVPLLPLLLSLLFFLGVFELLFESLFELEGRFLFDVVLGQLDIVTGLAVAPAHQATSVVTPSPLAMLMVALLAPLPLWPSRITNGRVKK